MERYNVKIETGYNPLELSRKVEELTTRTTEGVEERLYYRFRSGRWYGGIATGDVVGCNLRCGFCWSWRNASHEMRRGEFYRPLEVYKRLVSIAKRKNYRLIRLSGGEPTISRKHLLQLLRLFKNTNYKFILETNGILIGSDKTYAKQLSQYSNLIVRVSLKGTCKEEFYKLTLASPEAYNLQLNALKNLVDEGFEPGVNVYPAVMLSFTTSEDYEKLKEELEAIHPLLPREVDEEYVILYPHVVELLEKRRLKPKIAYTPNGIPREMI